MLAITIKFPAKYIDFAKGSIVKINKSILKEELHNEYCRN